MRFFSLFVESNSHRSELPPRGADVYLHHFRGLPFSDVTWNGVWCCPSIELNLAVTRLYLEKYFPVGTVTDRLWASEGWSWGTHSSKREGSGCAQEFQQAEKAEKEARERGEKKKWGTICHEGTLFSLCIPVLFSSEKEYSRCFMSSLIWTKWTLASFFLQCWGWNQEPHAYRESLVLSCRLSWSYSG